MAHFIVRPARAPLRGSVPVPSDKSIGHRALLLAALARGTSRLSSFAHGEDNVATLRILRRLGIEIRDSGQGEIVVEGRGLAGLSAPAAELDCENSGTTMRLLSGVLAAQPFVSRLVGDASLSRRPMARIAEPLRRRGAKIEGQPHPSRPGEITAPLVIGPADMRLLPLEYAAPVASAQVKGALLLSGLFASGPTVIHEPIISRDHTERMLSALGMPLETAGPLVSLHPPASPDAIRAFTIDLPGDLSAAAFPLVAAALVAGSEVTTRRTGLNPTRAGVLDALRLFGATVRVAAAGDELGEPHGEVFVRHSNLSAQAVAGELAVRAIDEIPILAAVAARARGSSEFGDLAELRVKESDRISAIVSMLRSFGVEAEERDHGFVVEGQSEHPLRAARVDSQGDHRIAMAAAVLGLVADGETRVDDVDCVRTSFPRFAGTLRALGAELEVSE